MTKNGKPNLQNIPIRTKEGLEIRRALEHNMVLTDYVQIELQILSWEKEGK